MYDLNWARQVVEDFLVLCTRVQLTEREFDEFQTDYGVKTRVSFADCLMYCVAASQNSQEAGRLWNTLKRTMKRPPARAKPVEEDLRDLYLWGVRRGRSWHQAMFEFHIDNPANAIF